MGKDRKRSHSDSDDSSGSDSSEDDRRHHKSRSTDASKHKSSKSSADKEKKHKKDKKKHKKHKGKDKEKDIVKQAKEFLKAQLAASGSGPEQGAGGGLQVTSASQLPAATLNEDMRITEDDYFAKSAEYTAWLLEERRLYFNEMTTEQTHELFKEFVAYWNAEKLKPAYYYGQIAAPARRTTHKWNIKGAAAPGAAAPPTARGTAAFLDDQKDRTAAQKALERVEQKKWKADQKQVLDELLPKATGREAVVEKRIARREEARARESSPDLVRIPGGGDVYGDDDSFAAAKAREAKRLDNSKLRGVARAEAVNHAAAAFQAKEEDKLAAFKALVAQGPIVIRKRQD